MDPRTFLPPRTLPVALAPEPGTRAPELPVAIDGECPTVITFLRHAGCPFAEATMRMLRVSADRHRDVAWVAVSHASGDATRRWCEAIGGCGRVHTVSDPSRRIYAAWGLGRTSLAHFMGRHSLGAVVAHARRGIRNRHPSGTRWQSAGTFAVDTNSMVCWRHLPKHAGDLPDLDAAMEALA